jgi:competence protein ComFC
MMSVLPHLHQLKGAALDFLFPRFCVGCGKEGDFICNSCQAALIRIEPPVCPKCGKPQTSSAASSEMSPLLCSNCVDWEADIDAIRSPFRFEGVIRKAVHEFKYRNLRASAGRLAALMGDYLDKYPASFDVLAPVPLHPKRLKERGYNQSQLLANELGKLTGAPVNDNCLERTIYNVPQAKTRNVEERRRNVIGIFSCKSEDFLEKRVLLIDDVTTSGATLNSCATALKKAGAASVWGLTLAREI